LWRHLAAYHGAAHQRRRPAQSALRSVGARTAASASLGESSRQRINHSWPSGNQRYQSMKAGNGGNAMAWLKKAKISWLAGSEAGGIGWRTSGVAYGAYRHCL
jgi:hypothetical protein